jgi:hypothetical protein
MTDQMKGFVPYSALSQGFEAIYTGNTSSEPIQETNDAEGEFTDPSGNVCFKWDLWALSGVKAAWGPDIEHLNSMQEQLVPLDDETRKLRQHISSLVHCDSGIPITIDELLQEIAVGRVGERPFHNGCWMCPGDRSTQLGQEESMAVIETVLQGHLEGRSEDEALAEHPHAAGFVRRTYEWLGQPGGLSKVQQLMLERMLLPFECFTRRNPDRKAANEDCFGEGGRGAALDEKISAAAGLPRIFADYKPEFRQNLESIDDPDRKVLYRICGAIAHGAHGISDCHHSTFRWVESWIHGIGTGKWDIPSRKEGTERQRIRNALFGYALGLDRWLLGTPMQFLLLDLGHVDLGFDPKNEVLRVYAHLGEEKTPVKEWLVACLWRHLCNALDRWNLHHEFLNHAAELGVGIREWMESRLRTG